MGVVLPFVPEPGRPQEVPPAAHRNAAGVLALASVFAGLGNYVYALSLTHGLSPADYTIFAGSQSLIVMVGLLGSAGVPLVLARETAVSAADPQRLRDAVRFAFKANLALGLFASAAVGAGTLVFAPLPDALVVAATTIVLAIGSTGLGFLQGKNRITAIAGVFAAEVLLKLAVGSILVFLAHRNVLGALLGGLAGASALLWCLSALKGHVSWRPSASIGPTELLRARSLWRATGRISLLQIGVGLIAALDTLLIAVLTATRAEGGVYQAASALGKVPLFLAAAISTAVFPQLVASGRLHHRVEALLSLTLLTSFYWAALASTPPSVIRLIFSADFASVSRWLPYTAALGAGLGALNVMTTFVQSETSGRAGLSVVAVTACAFVLCCVVAATRWGVHGLAIAAIAATWSGVLALSGLRTERAAAVLFLRRMFSARGAVAVASVISLTVARHHTAAWLSVAAVAGLTTVLTAFPDLGERLARLLPRARGI